MSSSEGIGWYQGQESVSASELRPYPKFCQRQMYGEVELKDLSPGPPFPKPQFNFRFITLWGFFSVTEKPKRA